MTEVLDSKAVEWTERQLRIARVCLVLGIAAVVASPLLIGALFGVAAIAIAFVTRRPEDSGAKQPPMRLTGLVLAGCGVFLSLCAFQLYRAVARHGAELIRYVQQEAGSTSDEAHAWVGRLAPDLEFVALDGTQMRLSELRGRRVVLDFWATWCPPCVKQIPGLIDLTESSDTEELIVVGVSEEDWDTLSDFVKEKGINYPIGQIDRSDLAEPYRSISAIPTVFFIDRNGLIQSVKRGYRPPEEVRALAEADDATEEELAAARAAEEEATETEPAVDEAAAGPAAQVRQVTMGVGRKEATDRSLEEKHAALHQRGVSFAQLFTQYPGLRIEDHDGAHHTVGELFERSAGVLLIDAALSEHRPVSWMTLEMVLDANRDVGALVLYGEQDDPHPAWLELAGHYDRELYRVSGLTSDAPRRLIIGLRPDAEPEPLYHVDGLTASKFEGESSFRDLRELYADVFVATEYDLEIDNSAGERVAYHAERDRLEALIVAESGSLASALELLGNLEEELIDRAGGVVAVGDRVPTDEAAARERGLEYFHLPRERLPSGSRDLARNKSVFIASADGRTMTVDVQEIGS